MTTNAETIDHELVLDAELVEEEAPTKHSVAKFIARTSVKFVVAGSIASIAPEAESKIQKAKLAIGTYVLADMVSRSTGIYVEEKISAWKKDIQEVYTLVKKMEAAAKGKSETPAP